MGSWSVYCGISNISIVSGRKCVLLMLKKSNYNEYAPYSPALLPIFGEYDDYGGLENIEKNDATKMLENHFECTVEEFSHFFTRKDIRDDEDDFPKFLKKNKEIKNWNFMFIDREVYDFLSSYAREGYDGKGYFDFGDPTILKLLGFVQEGTKQNKDRYKQIWSLNGKRFLSDGSYLKLEDNQNISIYIFKHLEDLVTIPKENMWLKEKFANQLWKHYPFEKRVEKLMPILGVDRSLGIELRIESKMLESKLSADIDEEDLKYLNKITPKGIVGEYIKNLEKVGDELVNLTQIRHNLYCFSQFFKPYQLYITPQCGEFKEHQVILEKFCEINKNLMIEHGYDDDE